MSLTTDEIKQNLIDRGRALDLFMTRRMEIISALKSVRIENRGIIPKKRKIYLRYREEKLIERLHEISCRTEATLNEIRRRRTDKQNANNDHSGK